MAKQPPLPFFILRGHEGKVTALHFNNDTDNAIDTQPTLFSGSSTGEIFIWNLQSFRALFKFTSPEKKIILFIKYYRSKLISQSNDGVINIWSFYNSGWNVKKKFKSDSAGLCASVFWLSGDKAFITLLKDEYLLEIYNIDEDRKTNESNVNSNKGLCVCLKVITLRGKQLFLVGFENGAIELRDCVESSELHSVNIHKDMVTSLDFDSEFKMRGISGSADEFLQIWSISDDYCLESVHEITLTKPGISDVKIRHDGKIVITAGWDFSIQIFSWKTLKPLAFLNFHEQSIRCLACSSFPVDKKNSVFASGSEDKSIALWSIY